MKATFLKAILEMGGSCTTPTLRDHMKIIRANNFASNLNECYNQQFLSKKKSSARGGYGNVWHITALGKKFIKDNAESIMPYERVAEILQERHDAMKTRKLGKSSSPSIKVSKGATAAVDSLVNLIDENRNLHALLKTIRAQIDAALSDDEPETQT